MEQAAAPVLTHDEILFQDGIGERRLTTDPTGLPRELLCIRPELTAVPAFEFALRERVARLAEFRHPYFAPARSVERLTTLEGTLCLVSDRLEGLRLSTLFAQSAARGLNPDVNVALCLIRQIVPAVARLHESCRDVAHGALGPERVVLTTNGRLMVTEYVMGAALEQLRYSQDRYWRELRVAVPRSAGLPRFDHRADVTQIGVIALSLILGRGLRDDEYPGRVSDVVASAKAIAPKGGFEPLPPALRTWLACALQIDVRRAFATVAEANEELERIVADLEYPGLPASVDAFLERFRQSDAPDAALPTSVTVSGVPVPEDATASVSTTRLEQELGALRDFRPEGEIATSAVAEIRPAKAPAVSAPVPGPAPTADAPLRAQEAPVTAGSNEAAPGSEAPGSQALPIAATPARGPATKTAPAAAHPRHVGRAAVEPSSTPAPGSAASTASVPVRDLFSGGEDAAPRRRWVGPAAVVAVVTMVAAGVAWSRRAPSPAAPPPAAAPSTGTLVITTSPAGALALIDGREIGTTPVTVPVSPGSHTLELRGGGEPKSIPVTMTAGARVEQYIELPAPATEPSASAPAGHAAASGSASPTPVPAVPAAVPTGWLAVRTPVELTIEEDGRVIGTSAAKVSLPAGAHAVVLRNDALGFRVSRTIQVTADKVASAAVEMPNGVVALNALPWAEVWLDGKRLGETPIGNLAVPIGTHQVVMRHPDLGERTQPLTVSLTEVARLSVDFRRQ